MSEDRVQIYRDDAGEWRWRFKSTNSRILADSGEGYTNREDCFSAIETVFHGDLVNLPTPAEFASGQASNMPGCGLVRSDQSVLRVIIR